MRVVEYQFLTAEAVRQMCIDQGLCRHATQEDERRLNEMICGLSSSTIITAGQLLPIAREIIAHSDGVLELTNMMYRIGRLIVRCYDLVEDDGDG